jgi:hypothetical protein
MPRQIVITIVLRTSAQGLVCNPVVLVEFMLRRTCAVASRPSGTQ